MPDPDGTTEQLRKKRKWPRRVRTVVLCLLAGAIINVLVALGFTWHFYGNYARLYEQHASFSVDKRGALEIYEKLAPFELNNGVSIHSRRHSPGFVRVEIHSYHTDEIWTFNIQRTMAGWCSPVSGDDSLTRFAGGVLTAALSCARGRCDDGSCA